MAEQPEVHEGQWIKIGHRNSSQDGLVMKIYDDGSLSVGYYQNHVKAVKEDVIWTGEYWKFKYPGPQGIGLSGREELKVKNGPPPKT